MINKKIADLTSEDINQLVKREVREQRTLDYKQLLPGESDEHKREFLADVSSFANAAGGDLVFGVAAENGVPKVATGLRDFVEDKERLRLESVIRDGIAPRFQGAVLKAVEGSPNGPVLVLRMPKSWSTPHMVTYKNLSRFFTRSSAGKYQMDISEIRSAFAVSEELPEQIRRWRDERLGRIIADEAPVVLSENAKACLHLVPLASFSNDNLLPTESILKQRVSFQPLGAGGWNHRINIDGLLTFTGAEKHGARQGAYCQMFRSGRIEAVTSGLADLRDGERWVATAWFERVTVTAMQSYLKGLEALEVPTPIVAASAIVGARGAYMRTSDPWRSVDPVPIDRDLILLPDVMVEGYSEDVARVLRPMFDAIWNVAGYARSMSYDAEGSWKPPG